jgi:hypothetical protein
MKIRLSQLRSIIRDVVSESWALPNPRVYVVAVLDTGTDIDKAVFTLDPKDKNSAKRPEQFSVDYAARLGKKILDVIVTDVPASDFDAGRGIEHSYGNEYQTGDPPSPKLSRFSPVGGGWNPASAPKSSDRGY